ncbi:serine/threonine-protein kinase [Nonomuraea terrae]|uniref:serine/threonine-protein kinase n=1 Tax=Nonomuraea terrae TaxID=2530383 RepID=UPI0037916BED
MRPLRPGDPERIAGYRLLGVLGSGGQGVVYKAVGEAGREVAIKVLHGHLVQDDDVRRGFLREAEAARRVAAFCTAAILDAGVADVGPYIVSEYVPGDTLQALVRASGPRTGGALDRLAISTLTALAAIHQAGIVHRDFKPANVLMGPDGPIVIDFGIAKALDATTHTSGVTGTPAYMSPEQFRGERVGAASDVFSWAGTIVFAATGHPPFAGGTLPDTMNTILNGTPDLDDVPPHLVSVLETCLAKDPSLRPRPSALLHSLIHRSDPVIDSPDGRGSGSPRALGKPRVPADPGPPPSPVVREREVGRGGREAGALDAQAPSGGQGADGTTPQRGGSVSRRVFIGGSAAAAAVGVSAFAVLRSGNGLFRADAQPTRTADMRRTATGEPYPSDGPSPSSSDGPGGVPSGGPSGAAEPLGTVVGEPVALGGRKPTALGARGGTVVCGTGTGEVFVWTPGAQVVRVGDGGGAGDVRGRR